MGAHHSGIERAPAHSVTAVSILCFFAACGCAPAQPAAQSSAQPPTQPSAPPATQPAAQSAAQSATQPPTQSAAQSAAQSATQPPTQPATQPPAQPAPQPAAQSATQPPTQPSAQPATRPAAQSATPPPAQPAAQPPAQPATQPAAQPATRPAAQPATPPPAQPAAQPPAQPAPQPAAQSPAPPAPEELARMLDAARAYALDYSQTLPDFICDELVRRYREGMDPGTWTLTDTLTVRLSYYGRREDYKLVLVNNKPAADRSYESLTGSISEGEFGSLLRQVFEAEASTQIRFARWDSIGDKLVAVFGYRMTAAHARYAVNFVLNDQRYSTLAGRRGLVFVDPASGAALRITSAADALPADFPVQKLASTLEYAPTAIGGRTFVLPRAAEVEMQAGTYQTRNAIEFQTYHKFDAATDVFFDPANTK